MTTRTSITISNSTVGLINTSEAIKSGNVPLPACISERVSENRGDFYEQIWKALLAYGEAEVSLKNGRVLVVEIAEDSLAPGK